ncbi:nucleotidyltransferase [Herbivorax sp. ANBcel31]|uniref:nucleotidyltransferase n=1 Tax=Herbivorax sp. ANBcel31 TaxID=3069754 RepID=UPI0027B3F1E9|nr:nucleotidyltransferase [Herbivorax sp. ANBcel31]MDQ2085007.1 nucleotidyltransferase [Herbivorax sp. ANBcel31]
MKVLGVIVEYNPFHNGHLYHIEQAKKITGAEYVICIMSGNFIQRGEPAIINKWARAKTALLNGVDLVIELPVTYALSSAEYFAHGAVKILNDIGIVDYLCFGSESGETKTLDIIANILYNEPDLYKSILKKELKKGLSYPASRENALAKYLYAKKDLNLSIDKLLSQSNNILGIEYLKALKRLNSNITPVTIKRINNSYNTEDITGSISSATAIRKHLLKSMNCSVQNVLDMVLPKTSYNIVNEEITAGRGPISPSCFYDIISALIRKSTSVQLKEIMYVSEGLENRIKSATNTTGTYNDLLEKICTKRYTVTRIQRILMNIMLGITSKDITIFNSYNGPQYARVLGFNQRGKYLMSLIKKNSSIPMILKTANFINSCNPLLRKMLELESISTDIYVLGYKNSAYRKASQEFTQNVIII